MKKYSSGNGYTLRNKNGKRRWVRNTREIPRKRLDPLDTAGMAVGAGVGAGAGYFGRREFINNRMMKNHQAYASSKGVRDRHVDIAQRNSEVHAFTERELKNIMNEVSNPTNSKTRTKSLLGKQRNYEKILAKSAKLIGESQHKMIDHQTIMEDATGVIKKLSSTRITPRVVGGLGAIAGLGLGASVYVIRNRNHKRNMVLKIDAELRKEKDAILNKRRMARSS